MRRIASGLLRPVPMAWRPTVVVPGGHHLIGGVGPVLLGEEDPDAVLIARILSSRQVPRGAAAVGDEDPRRLVVLPAPPPPAGPPGRAGRRGRGPPSSG